nr:MAG TPA: hypothetical protein [Caudoviricetes sp.]
MFFHEHFDDFVFLQSYNPTIRTQPYTKILIISDIRKLLHTKINLQHLKNTSYTTYKRPFCRFHTLGRQILFKSTISYNFLQRPTNLQKSRKNKKQHNTLISIYIHIDYK